jgi:hypothetical protein
MLLTNPGRLTADEHLYIDCPGDEYRLEAEDVFDRALCFLFIDSELHFMCRCVVEVGDDFGSATGFSAV